MWGSHDLTLNSPVTSLIGLESPLLAVLACLGSSRKINAQRLATFATQSANSGHERESKWSCERRFLTYVEVFRLIYLNERVARPLFVFVELNERLAA
jgi:hypothetical protein